MSNPCPNVVHIEEATCKDCFHYCVCKDTVADENWEEDAPKEIREMFSPRGCKNYVPTASLVEAKYGVWVEHIHPDAWGYHASYTCSICGKEKDDNTDSYCQDCGAEMKPERK